MTNPSLTPEEINLLFDQASQNTFTWVNGPNPQRRAVTQWRRFIKHGGRTYSTSPSLELSALRKGHEMLIETAGESHGRRVSNLFG